MKNNETLYKRLVRWIEGDAAGKDAEETAEHAEFVEYLEYLDSHEHVDYHTYHQMRTQERSAHGLPAEKHRSNEVVIDHTDGEPGAKDRRSGWLRRASGIYRALSVLLALLLLLTFSMVALNLPGFGDPAAPAVNEVSDRYLEQGVKETGAVNAVAGMILDYRAFDTFGESTVLFAATMSVLLLMRRSGKRFREEAGESRLLMQVGRLVLPIIMMYGIYVVLNGHLSPGGGFSGGTVLGCGLILGALSLGQAKMDQLLPPARITKLTVACLLSYGAMKGYSFFTGANHVGWEIPKGIPGNIFSSGFILPLNICVGIIVGCTMYCFYTLFAEKEA